MNQHDDEQFNKFLKHNRPTPAAPPKNQAAQVWKRIVSGSDQSKSQKSWWSFAAPAMFVLAFIITSRIVPPKDVNIDAQSKLAYQQQIESENEAFEDSIESAFVDNDDDEEELVADLLLIGE